MFVLSILLCIIAGLGAYLWSMWREARNFWKKHGFETIGATTRRKEHAWACMGMHEMDINSYQYVKSLNKPFMGRIEFVTPTLLVTDMDLARQIVIKDFDTFINRRKFGVLDSPCHMISKMLLFMEGDAWRELRAKMSPTFTTGKIRRLFDCFNTSSMELVEYLRKQAAQHDQVVDFQDAFERYTMGVIASTAFGVDAKTFQEQESILLKMGRKMRLQMTPIAFLKFILLTLAPRLASAAGISLFEKKPEMFFIKLIKSVIEHRQKTGDVRDDFLQLMLEARSGQLKAVEESELSALEKEAGITATASKGRVVGLTELTDDVIVAQSILFILGGFDTTQSLLLFVVYELALNPEIQEQLSTEIEDALRSNGGQFSYDLVNQMDYLDKVVNETLRKYPPAFRMERRSVVDYKIPDTELVIPRDTLIVIPTYAIHHDEEHFPDPERFDPERFSKEVKSTRHPCAFQPFGHGPRNCIGMRFALTNAKMAIASIVHNFILEPSVKTLIPMKFTRNTNLKPASMFLRLNPRK